MHLPTYSNNGLEKSFKKYSTGSFSLPITRLTNARSSFTSVSLIFIVLVLSSYQ